MVHGSLPAGWPAPRPSITAALGGLGSALSEFMASASVPLLTRPGMFWPSRSFRAGRSSAGHAVRYQTRCRTVSCDGQLVFVAESPDVTRFEARCPVCGQRSMAERAAILEAANAVAQARDAPATSRTPLAFVSDNT